MVALVTALAELIRLDGGTVPEPPERAALIERVSESSWLKFALGVDAREPLPADDDVGLANAATEFAAQFAVWTAYRDCVLEVTPPGQAPVRFGISRRAVEVSAIDTTWPNATLTILTAWNPGSGEPRASASTNRRANERLAAQLDARQVERWSALNAPQTDWREEGFAVLGLELDEAWRIAESYGQRAIYFIDKGCPWLVARRRQRIVAWQGVLTATS